MRGIIFQACAMSVVVVHILSGTVQAYIPWEIAPALTVGGGYDDNVSLRPGHGEGSFVWRAFPSLGISLPLKRMDMTLDQSFYYYDNGKEGEKKAYQVQGKASANVIRDLLLSVSDKYLLVPVEVGRPAYSPINLTKANELDLGAQFTYDLAPTIASQWRYDFSRVDLFDILKAVYYSHKASLQIKKEVVETLSLYLGYSYLSQSFIRGQGSTLSIHEGAAGAIFLFHDLAGNLSSGLQSLDTGGAGRQSGWYLKADMRYPATERLEAKGSYLLNMGWEVTGHAYRAHTAQGGASYSLTPRIQTTALGEWGTYTFYGLPLSRTFWMAEAGLQFEIYPDVNVTTTYDHYEGKDEAGSVADNRVFLELRWVIQ